MLHHLERHIGWRVGKKPFKRSTGEADRRQAKKALSTHTAYNLPAEDNGQKRLTKDLCYSLQAGPPVAGGPARLGC